MSKHIALIPAYKPDEKLISLLKALDDTDMTAVVVNDGSGDEYMNIFKEAESYAPVIHHEVNKGKGCALKTGLSYIKENFKEEYIVVTLDADGQHTPEDALKVCSVVEENPRALALGSRFFDKSTPLRSRFGNGLTRFIYKISTGISVYDTQTGLRAFSNLLVTQFLTVPGDRYEYEMNVLLECKNFKIEIIETAIETIYIDNNSASHFNAVKDSIRIYKDILKFSASSLFSFAIDFLLYSLFLVLTGIMAVPHSLTVSNVLARCISSVINYTVNRKLVFKSEKNVVKSMVEYFILVIIILIGNTLVLNLFVKAFDINSFAAKIIIEVLFFFVSWAAQKFIVFRPKKTKK